MNILIGLLKAIFIAFGVFGICIAILVLTQVISERWKYRKAAKFYRKGVKDE